MNIGFRQPRSEELAEYFQSPSDTFGNYSLTTNDDSEVSSHYCSVITQYSSALCHNLCSSAHICVLMCVLVCMHGFLHLYIMFAGIVSVYVYASMHKNITVLSFSDRCSCWIFVSSCMVACLGIEQFSDFIQWHSTNWWAAESTEHSSNAKLVRLRWVSDDH